MLITSSIKVCNALIKRSVFKANFHSSNFALENASKIIPKTRKPNVFPIGYNSKIIPTLISNFTFGRSYSTDNEPYGSESRPYNIYDGDGNVDYDDFDEGDPHADQLRLDEFKCEDPEKREDPVIFEELNDEDKEKFLAGFLIKMSDPSTERIKIRGMIEFKLRKAHYEMRHLDVIREFGRLLSSEVTPESAEMYLNSLDRLGDRETDIAKTFSSLRGGGMPLTDHCYSIAAKAYMRLELPYKVLFVYKQLMEDNKIGDVEIYNTLLLIYSRDDPEDVETLDEIWKRMLRNGVFPDSTTLEILLLNYLKINRSDLAWSKYSKMLIFEVELSARANCLMAENMIYCNELNAARYFIRVVSNSHVKPRLATYDAMIYFYLNQGNDHGAAIRLMTELKKSARYFPTLNMYKHFLKYYIRHRNWGRFQTSICNVIRLKMAPDFEYFSLVLEGFYKMGRVDEFNRIFTLMLDRQIQPPRNAFTRRLELYACNSIEKMLLEYDYILQCGLIPTSYELRLITTTLYSHNQPQLAFDFIDREFHKFGLKKDGIDYILAIRAYHQVHDHENVEKTFDSYLSLNFPYNPEAQIFMIKHYLSVGNISKAFELWTEIYRLVRNNVFKLSVNQFTRIIDYFGTFLGNDAEEIIKSIIDLQENTNPEGFDRDSFEIAIQKLAKVDPEYSVRLLRTSTGRYRFKPSYEVYDYLFKGFAYQTIMQYSNHFIPSFVTLAQKYITHPMMQPYDNETIGYILLFFIEHANVDVLSYSIAWYNEIFKSRTKVLDPYTATVFRKWLCSLNANKVANETYISRELRGLVASGVINLNSTHVLDNRLLG